MTRFALIPLALLANACASADEVQDSLTDATEVQRDIDDTYADSDRQSDDHRQHLYQRARDMFAPTLQNQGCDMVGALVGGWADRSFRLKTDMVSQSGELIVSLEGRMRYTTNSEGEFGSKGHIVKQKSTVFMEGDWVGDRIEADLVFEGTNDDSFRVIGSKEQQGLGGEVIAVVADCD